MTFIPCKLNDKHTPVLLTLLDTKNYNRTNKYKNTCKILKSIYQNDTKGCNNNGKE